MGLGNCDWNSPIVLCFPKGSISFEIGCSYACPVQTTRLKAAPLRLWIAQFWEGSIIPRTGRKIHKPAGKLRCETPKELVHSNPCFFVQGFGHQRRPKMASSKVLGSKVRQPSHGLPAEKDKGKDSLMAQILQMLVPAQRISRLSWPSGPRQGNKRPKQ